MPVFDEKTAATSLGLSARTLQKRRFQCMQPGYYRIGKSIRYSQQEVDRFLEQHRIVPVGEAEEQSPPPFPFRPPLPPCWPSSNPNISLPTSSFHNEIQDQMFPTKTLGDLCEFHRQRRNPKQKLLHAKYRRGGENGELEARNALDYCFVL